MNYAPKGLGERVWERGRGWWHRCPHLWKTGSTGWKPLGTPLSQKTICNNFKLGEQGQRYGKAQGLIPV